MKTSLTLILALLGSTASSAAQSPPDLSGLWSAALRFGPDVRGTLFLIRTSAGWRADIAGFTVSANANGQAVAFELPGDRGSFRGTLVGREIHGHWIQPATQFSGLRYATPVTLSGDGTDRWRGTVTPLDDRFTFYLPLSAAGAGIYRTYLRNPERNAGVFFRVSRAEVRGDTVRLIGSTGEGDRTLSQGIFEEGTIRSMPLRGGSYDFARVADTTSGFYPRGNPAPRYRYTPPLQLADGWPVASVEDVGISRDSIERFIQMVIDLPMDSLGTSQVHSVLIARHGKLVLEEYFHGTHRDRPHDLRSASKSWVTVLIGAAMRAGVPIAPNTPVYKTLLGAEPAELDPRKRAMTLEHLMSMTAGYDCRPDMEAPRTADEDVMQSQAQERNWYRYALNVPLISTPGDTIYYCSAEPNLAAGMLEKIAREPLPELFDRLVGRPLQMGPYHLLLQPTGEAYGGGGHQFRPRDFMKLAQLMLHGRWGNREILNRDWVERSRAPLRNLSSVQQYGWLWNSAEYPYRGGKVRGFFAAGNGGQIFMGIPELDLVIAFTGGSYNMRALLIPQREYVPRYLLRALR